MFFPGYSEEVHVCQQNMEVSIDEPQEAYSHGNLETQMNMPMNTHFTDSFQDNNVNYNNSPAGKPYERRNKKRRPPGYYENLQKEIEAERTQKMGSSFDTIVEQNVKVYDKSYSSHCDKNNSDVITEQNMNTPQEYSSISDVQNSYRVNFAGNESVDRLTEDVSHVTLSSSNNYLPSHIVHETKESYSHSSFHISPSSNQQPQVPHHFTETVTYSPQQSHDPPFQSHDPQLVSLTDNKSLKSTNENVSDTLINQTNSGSISSDVNELTQKCEHENSKMYDNSYVDESENMVDFTSYPPLQSASNNIPIGAPVKQECPEKQSVGNETQDNTSIIQNENPEQPGSVWGKTKTWANLFKGDEKSTVIHTNSENFSDIEYATLNQENSAIEKQTLDMSPVPAIHDSAAEILGGKFQGRWNEGFRGEGQIKISLVFLVMRKKR